ncbi:MAG: hypothetical protein N838_19710 [Thiohalocapsa sp. PB-PSB1]|jgi:hypothetical protein|nr:MAG: hypothetical protein N838_19710 [Thiohalocapsa sp. PB-PSB1]
MASFTATSNLLVVDTDHYPHFGVLANGADPRGFAFADDPNKNAAFFTMAAVAKHTGKDLKIEYRQSNPNGPSIKGVSEVEIV